MPQPPREMILNLQKTLKKDYGREVSFAEAFEAAHNLLGFFSLLLEVDMRNNPQRYKPKKKKIIKVSKYNYETMG